MNRTLNDFFKRLTASQVPSESDCTIHGCLHISYIVLTGYETPNKRVDLSKNVVMI